jgi:hypothetical protein
MNWPASLAAPLPRAVIFIGREDRTTRAVAQVLCAARALQAGTGGRRWCLPTSEMKYPKRGCVNNGTEKVNALKRRLCTRFNAFNSYCACGSVAM